MRDFSLAAVYVYSFADAGDAELMRWAQHYRRRYGYKFTLTKVICVSYLRRDSIRWLDCGGALQRAEQ